MTTEDAKDILEAIDLELAPPMTDELRAALALMEEDESLRSWYEEQRAMDREISAILHSQEVTLPDLDEIQPKQRYPLMSRRGWLIAAGGMIGMGLGGYWMGSRPVYRGATTALAPDHKARLHELRDFLTVLVAKGIRLDLKESDPLKAQAWLDEQQMPTCELGALTAFDSMGCMLIDWRGAPVSLLCFLDEQKHPFHLFRIPQSLCEPAGVAVTKPLTQMHLDRNTTSWDRDDCVCMLVAHKPGQDLPTQLA